MRDVRRKHTHTQSRWQRPQPQDGWLSDCYILNLLPLSGCLFEFSSLLYHIRGNSLELQQQECKYYGESHWDMKCSFNYNTDISRSVSQRMWEELDLSFCCSWFHVWFGVHNHQTNVYTVLYMVQYVCIRARYMVKTKWCTGGAGGQNPKLCNWMRYQRHVRQQILFKEEVPLSWCRYIRKKQHCPHIHK